MSFLSRCYHRCLIFLRKLRLKNHGFTILANNCSAGIMYHDLGERFCSPTINLFIPPNDFLLLMENFEECITKSITQIQPDDNVQYPVGVIKLDNGQTVRIDFMHYKSFSEAAKKWDERKKRINRENLFVFLEFGIMTTDEMIDRFEKLPYNKLAATNKQYPYCDTKYLDIYEDYHWGKILEFIPGTLHTKRYLDKLNYIKWLNRELK